MPLKINIDEVVKSLRDKNSAMSIAVRGAAVKGMRDYEAYIVKTFYSGRNRQGMYGLNTQSKQLRSSWSVKELANESGTVNQKIQLATSSPYARIHEYGGTITPKTSKSLAIPLNKEAAQTKPRSIPNLFYFQSKRTGKGILAMASGKGIKPMYALRKSVKIPKRTNVLPDFKRVGKQLVINRINTAVRAVLKGGTSGSTM